MIHYEAGTFFKRGTDTSMDTVFFGIDSGTDTGVSLKPGLNHMLSLTPVLTHVLPQKLI
jgi:hypothetical protein